MVTEAQLINRSLGRAITCLSQKVLGVTTQCIFLA